MNSMDQTLFTGNDSRFVHPDSLQLHSNSMDFGDENEMEEDSDEENGNLTVPKKKVEKTKWSPQEVLHRKSLFYFFKLLIWGYRTSYCAKRFMS
jgi:hypothetical protein